MDKAEDSDQQEIERERLIIEDEAEDDTENDKDTEAQYHDEVHEDQETRRERRISRHMRSRSHSYVPESVLKEFKQVRDLVHVS